TAVPAVTELPKDTAVSAVTELPKDTAVPAVTELPAETAVPVVTEMPKNTAVAASTNIPVVTSVPEESAQPAETHTGVSAVTQQPLTTLLPTFVPVFTQAPDANAESTLEPNTQAFGKGTTTSAAEQTERSSETGAASLDSRPAEGKTDFTASISEILTPAAEVTEAPGETAGTSFDGRQSENKTDIAASLSEKMLSADDGTQAVDGGKAAPVKSLELDQESIQTETAPVENVNADNNTVSDSAASDISVPKPPEGFRLHYTVGDKGYDVLAIKRRLLELGYYSVTTTFNDVYNSYMAMHVREFQKNNNLPVNGEIGEAEMALLFPVTVK
ncbi:MAG: peptidoglycan-binding protein, partial [Clostridia bacterium]|nr:peptidoglycan-binding protein [Clostridia bacterium]